MGGVRRFRQRNGRFRRPPSLEELGFDVNDEERVCNECGHHWIPLLKSGVCPKCKATDSRPAAEKEGNARD